MTINKTNFAALLSAFFCSSLFLTSATSMLVPM
jgi:hypothetical protein